MLDLDKALRGLLEDRDVGFQDEVAASPTLAPCFPGEILVLGERSAFGMTVQAALAACLATLLGRHGPEAAFLALTHAASLDSGRCNDAISTASATYG